MLSVVTLKWYGKISMNLDAADTHMSPPSPPFLRYLIASPPLPHPTPPPFPSSPTFLLILRILSHLLFVLIIIIVYLSSPLLQPQPQSVCGG